MLDRSLLLGLLSRKQLKYVAQLDQTKLDPGHEEEENMRFDVPEELDDVEEDKEKTMRVSAKMKY